MVHVLLMLLALDLANATPAPGRAVKDLALSLAVDGGAIRGGAQQVRVRAILTNVGPKTLAVVHRPSGPQPLTVVVDGVDTPLPHGIARAALPAWRALAPGEAAAWETMVILPVGKHRLALRYAVDDVPYGERPANLWRGTLTMPPAEVTIPAQPFVGHGLGVRLQVVEGGPILGGGQQVTVRALLTNDGPGLLSVIVAPSGRQPLSFVVDGVARALPDGPADDFFADARALAPGETAAYTTVQLLGVGTHRVAWRYALAACPPSAAGCFTGTVDSPTVVVKVPVP